MDEKFFDKTGDLIASLLTHGYLPADKPTYPTEGNLIRCTYTNGGTKVRITKDRGCYLVDALPAALSKEEWVGMTRVISFLKSKRPGEFTTVAAPTPTAAEQPNPWNLFVADVRSNLRLINRFFAAKIFAANYEVLELFEEKNGRPELSFPEA